MGETGIPAQQTGKKKGGFSIGTGFYLDKTDRPGNPLTRPVFLSPRLGILEK